MLKGNIMRSIKRFVLSQGQTQQNGQTTSSHIYTAGLKTSSIERDNFFSRKL
jgi:hypothetical protein